MAENNLSETSLKIQSTAENIFMDDGINLETKITNIINDKITIPDTATVGDLLKVEEVDENGKPTRFSAASNYYTREQVDNIINNLAEKFSTEQTNDGFILKYNNTTIATIPIYTPSVTVGSIDTSTNDITLTSLSAGTYTLKYENEDGELSDFADIGTTEVQ